MRFANAGGQDKFQERGLAQPFGPLTARANSVGSVVLECVTQEPRRREDVEGLYPEPSSGS